MNREEQLGLRMEVDELLTRKRLGPSDRRLLQLLVAKLFELLGLSPDEEDERESKSDLPWE